MNSSLRRVVTAGALAGIPLLAAPQQSLAQPAFEIPALFRQECEQCHGEAQQMAGLDLRSREALLDGGQSGPAIVPGDAETSPLYLRVTGAEQPAMPVGRSLRPNEVAAIRRWIEEGAHWEPGPDQARTADSVERSGRGTANEDGRWWAFQRPVRHSVPEVSDSRWDRNPIDAFLQEQREKNGLTPAPPADRRTLIRRAYLDLIGLLPPPEEVEAFLSDDSKWAFNELVDRLLGSPHYGERWGRHWLDIARYADSKGYEQDYDNPNAWRYRDYVIQAFNQDKPYSRFVLEQLAGDELDDMTFDSVTALGFHRVGPRVAFREKDNPEYRYTYLDDMIGTTSRAFMGLTVNCARCHDHKFDPITQMDYYRMLAVFFPYVDYDFPLAPPDVVARHEARVAEIEAVIMPLKRRLAEIEAPYRERAFEERLRRFPRDIQVAVHTPEEDRTDGQKLLAAQVRSIGPGRGFDSLMPEKVLATVQRLRAEIRNLEQQKPEDLPLAVGIRDGDFRFAPDGPGDSDAPGKGRPDDVDFEGSYLPEVGRPYVPPKTHFLPSGDYRTKGSEVSPGYPKVLLSGYVRFENPPVDGRLTTGRRRALSEWLVDPEHPLTARVMVNRIWQHHFGEGIVSTPSNFGRMGHQPTHAELLDWLATEFVRSGWSMKSMHRLIMTSESYRMASSFALKANEEADPRNAYLWRFPQQRLEGEIIRDLVLAASGNLNLAVGGKPYFPAVDVSVRNAVAKGIWVVSEEAPNLWRRGLYSYYKRGMPYPMFEVFDQPDLNITCEGRDTTTVATQALTLLNNDFVLRHAESFARRVQRIAGPEQEDLVRTAYRIALGRDPMAAELEWNVSFLNQQMALYRDDGSDDPARSALADLCHVVLNLNEFVYIN
ncbi:MAG: PSD1 and planctomycete cytochrome C domain-containing protein [Bryobacterales bacterium]|nr:PSD1 and planctomycete cytochrome C domain-containing protein [Bryobacterales bacterium]